MNIPDDDMELIELTVTEARKLVDGDEEVMNKVLTVVDNAQAPVFGGEKARTYFVIEINAD